MSTLVRRAFKVFLFCVLFLLAGRYVHTYPMPMTRQQQHYLIVISESFGVDDYEMFYIAVVVFIDLIVAIAVYMLILKLGRRYWMNRRHAQ
jgi:hypothetical protein